MAPLTSIATGPTIDVASDNPKANSGSATNAYISSPIKANMCNIFVVVKFVKCASFEFFVGHFRRLLEHFLLDIPFGFPGLIATEFPVLYIYR